MRPRSPARACGRSDLRSAALGVLGAALCLVLSGSSLPNSPGDVGAGSTVVASCDSSIDLSWADDPSSPTYSGSPGVGASTFELSGLVLSNVDASCNSLAWDIALVDAADVALTTQSGVLSVTAGTATISFAPTDGKDVARTVVAIHG